MTTLFKKRVTIYGTMALVFGLWFTWGFWADLLIDKQLIEADQSLVTAQAKEEKRLQWIGLRGDSYGSLNALLTGLAFLGVVLSLSFQEESIARARKEARAAQEQADATLQIQQQLVETTKRTAQLDAINAWVSVLDILISEQQHWLSNNRLVTESNAEETAQRRADLGAYETERRSLYLQRRKVLDLVGVHI